MGLLMEIILKNYFVIFFYSLIILLLLLLLTSFPNNNFIKNSKFFIYVFVCYDPLTNNLIRINSHHNKNVYQKIIIYKFHNSYKHNNKINIILYTNIFKTNIDINNMYIRISKFPTLKF